MREGAVKVVLGGTERKVTTTNEAENRERERERERAVSTKAFFSFQLRRHFAFQASRKKRNNRHNRPTRVLQK